MSNCNYCSLEKLLFLHVDVKERTNRHHSHCFTSSENTYFSEGKWWARQDLNLWPRAYQARALTNWATGPIELVEVTGFEPMTSCLQSRRSTNWAIPPDLCECRIPKCQFQNLGLWIGLWNHIHGLKVFSFWERKEAKLNCALQQPWGNIPRFVVVRLEGYKGLLLDYSNNEDPLSFHHCWLLIRGPRPAAVTAWTVCQLTP